MVWKINQYPGEFFYFYKIKPPQVLKKNNEYGKIDLSDNLRRGGRAERNPP
jgi:hypothetical protein